MRSHHIAMFAIALGLPACKGETSPAKPPAAKAEVVAHESELLKLTLTREAQARLGIAIVRVGNGSTEATRETSGEIVVPAGAGGVPIGSASNLAQIGSQQAVADGEVARTQALVRLAAVAFERAKALVDAEAGSVRARDEAAAGFATARAAAAAALTQRRMLGPSVQSIGSQRVLWVRVPVFGTDVTAIELGRPALVRPLGKNVISRATRPVAAPPSANAIAGTVDLYFALDNRDRLYRIGQRVGVTLPLAGGKRDGLLVPIAAVVRDIDGGAWVYRRTAPDTFIRQRIEIASVAGGNAILSRGLERGADIVTAGAAELFGTEFGVAH